MVAKSGVTLVGDPVTVSSPSASESTQRQSMSQVRGLQKAQVNQTAALPGLCAQWLSLAHALRSGRAVPSITSLLGTEVEATEGRARASSCTSPRADLPELRPRSTSASTGAPVINPENRLVLREIDKDIHRTFPELEEFNTPAMHAQLRQLLLAYSIHNPALGYAQGLNFICGFMLLRSGGHRQAVFEIFVVPSTPGPLCDDRDCVRRRY